MRAREADVPRIHGKECPVEMKNVHPRTVQQFSDIWRQHGRSLAKNPNISGGHDVRRSVDAYFSIFPLDCVAHKEGFDLGCGMGRVAHLIAPRVGLLHCIDPSPTALEAAQKRMGNSPNVRYHLASVAEIPLADESQDFGYSLGVLHHVPDTEAGLRTCVAKLKKGAPFLLYLYYNFDNRPVWFRALWKVSDIVRRGSSRLPFTARRALSDIIAFFVYAPLSRTALLLEHCGLNIENFPLSYYRRAKFGTLRADSLDRFGTSLERRFSRTEMQEMMIRAGLGGIRFREEAPYWVAVGWKT